MYFINQFFVMFTDRGNSPVSYLLEGVPGSRILKLEWKNMGFDGEKSALGTTDDFINVQLWLYEGSNDIEIIIGPNSVVHPNESYYGYGGPWIGIDHIISYPPGAVIEAISLEGDPANPTLVYNDSTFDIYLNGTPVEGTIYKFTYNTTGDVEKDLVRGLKVYPNPSSDILNVELPDGAEVLKVFNINGEILRRQQLNKDSDICQINITDFSVGCYFIEIMTESGEYSQKIFKE
jgi:hypothetical protein